MSDIISLKELHLFSGHAGQFWPAFSAFAGHQVAANYCVLLNKKSANWKTFYQWSKNQQPSPLSPEQIAELYDLAEECLQKGSATRIPVSAPGSLIIGQKLVATEREQNLVALFLIPQKGPERAADLLQRLLLIADTPAIYQRNREADKTAQKLDNLTDILDLLLIVNQERSFAAAAICLVNETAARYHCSRVGLGWAEDGYIKLQSLSHTEQFEQKMDAVTSLEAAMEEAFDQDEEILLSASLKVGPVKRDHAIYAKQQQIQDLVSIPLRCADQVVGVLTFERQQSSFNTEDSRVFRILADLVAERFAELKNQQRWFGAKLKVWLQEKAGKLLGPENTLLKLAGLFACIFLILSLVIQLPYRIEAPFILRSQDVRQVSAPFEGYIEDVYVKIGQQVEREELLLTLDDRDLLLEESAALANQIRYLREAEKARARGVLIDMRIAQAQAEQVAAQLALIRHRLQQTQLRSSMAGIIVDGDLEELRGAPVSQGEILFKVARHENLYPELKIAEQDIHELSIGQHGELAFVSRPGKKYPLLLEQIDPVALTDESGNIFLARGGGLLKPASWWRPGMSGIAKITVANRSFLWILSHRTIDFLRMLTWW